MQFSNLELSRRLERAEGYACAQFALARQRLAADSGAVVLECGDGYAVFAGVGSPVTQAFGLEINAATLDTVEAFFGERGASVDLEVSPFAGVAALGLLCDRGYRPIEISSVMYREVMNVPAPLVAVRIAGPEEFGLWAEVSAQGWSHEHPEFVEFLRETGSLAAARRDSVCFLAEYEGQPGAAGALSLHDGVALFAGSATVPAFRRRGLQAALLEERMRFAFSQGCDLAMMVAEIGSNSQRNGERQGFRVAYTRTKWRLMVRD